MATGSRNFSSKGQQTQKGFSAEPFAAGDYELKLHSDSCEIRQGSGPGKAPYISNLYFEAMGTAEEGRPNRRVYHNFFTSLAPGKDGISMPMRASGLVAFARAIGEEYEGSTSDFTGEGGEVFEALTPKEVHRWLKERDGQTCQGHVKVQAANKEYSAKNVISAFEEQEESAVSEGFSDDADEKQEVAGGFETEEPEVDEPPARKVASSPKNGVKAAVIQGTKKPAPAPAQKRR